MKKLILGIMLLSLVACNHAPCKFRVKYMTTRVQSTTTDLFGYGTVTEIVKTQEGTSYTEVITLDCSYRPGDTILNNSSYAIITEKLR